MAAAAAAATAAAAPVRAVALRALLLVSAWPVYLLNRLLATSSNDRVSCSCVAFIFNEVSVSSLQLLLVAVSAAVQVSMVLLEGVRLLLWDGCIV